MAIRPNVPVLKPGSNISGLQSDETRWVSGWSATTVGNPRAVETIQDSPLKGGMFKSNYNYLPENSDLRNDFYDNDIIIEAMNREEQMFPPWYPLDSIAWGSYGGQILRTIVGPRPENPAPGILRPFCLNSELIAYHYTQDRFYYELNLTSERPWGKPVQHGLDSNDKLCPMYVPWGDPYGSHDQWRIYKLAYDVRSDVFGDEGMLPEREGEWGEYLGSDFWGHSVFLNSFSYDVSGPIVDGRLVGCPFDGTARALYSLDTPDPLGRSIAAGWLLLSGNAEYWHVWENTPGWSPAEVMLDRESTYALYVCDV